MRQRNRRTSYMLAIGLAAGLLACLAYATGLFHGLELSTQDSRFSVRGTKTAPDDIVVVAVDERTFEELKQRFPFPRSLHGKLIDRLRKDGAHQIAYDVQFTEPTSPKEDNALIDAVAKAKHVVLSTTEVDESGHTAIFGGDDVLRDIGARGGDSTYASEPGGTLRRVDFAPSGLKSFSIAAVESASGKSINESDLGGSRAWIDYRGPPGTFRQYSFSQVLNGKVPPNALRGKTVVVGATASSLQDQHATPTAGNELMAGPEVQANAISTVERGFPLQSTPFGIDVLLILLLGMVAPAANLRLAPLRAFGLSVGVGVVYLVVVQFAFNSGHILPVVYPLLALAIAAVGALGVNYLFAAFERQRTRDTFARFVPEDVVDQVLAKTDDDLRLGGKREEVTVLFSDIRGFTTFSESRPPEEVIELLNRYLTEMSEAIMEHGGTLVSYIGDGIMAVFGAPIEQDDHADRAVAAAREMLETRLPRFNKWMVKRGYDEGFRMGVGLNSGPVMSGQVGSARRLDYTAIGDTVNTASRLEGLTKGTAHQLFVAESTKSRLVAGMSQLTFVDELPIRGREHGIKVWTSGASSGEAAEPEAGEHGAEEVT